ncbi:retropepsin-like aspartic protease [Alicyclobacillus suci]|uniref:retropepsin-like aspartic protease n=1 Tax=Alicyclobacillus suci TaxID=2816080 RepID=UPI001A8E814E|nr:retropepsin-like aspartic protease [Alicyclobacillus suci]
MNNLIALYHGSIRDNTFYFDPIINGQRVQNIVLDTGAFELALNPQVARQLRLPNLGPIQISGVGGAVSAYVSRCDIRMWKHLYRNVPCLVDPTLTEQGLFGLRFFIDNHLRLTLNPTKGTLAIRES